MYEDDTDLLWIAAALIAAVAAFMGVRHYLFRRAQVLTQRRMLESQRREVKAWEALQKSRQDSEAS